MLALYRQKIAAYFEQIETFCAKRNIEYLRASTVIPFEDLVLQVFTTRLLSPLVPEVVRRLMTWLNPAAFAFLAFIPIILLLHSLRYRRRDVRKHAFLWESVAREMQGTLAACVVWCKICPCSCRCSWCSCWPRPWQASPYDRRGAE